jgi:hypothetical protein
MNRDDCFQSRRLIVEKRDLFVIIESAVVKKLHMEKESSWYRVKRQE